MTEFPTLGSDLRPMTITLETALEYHDDGWCVVPAQPATKRPACGKWACYQTERPDEGMIRSWFGGLNRKAIAVVLGEVSGGLVCRDYDDVRAYDCWAEEHPDLAERLPTVETGRPGRHVYGICAGLHDFRKRFPDRKGIIPYPDGELRTAGIVLLPPSDHKSGKKYRWLIPPSGGVPTVDLDSAGWLPCNRENGADRGVQSQQRPLSGGSVALLHDGDRVEMAIARTLPTEEGQRNRQLFKFARELKAIPGFADLPLPKLKPIVRQWYRAAEPIIKTRCFDTSWFDFLRCWENSKIPLGQEPIVVLFEQAKAAQPPSAALQYESAKVRLLVALCAELQRYWIQRDGAGAPFYLDARTAGRLLGVEHTTAWRWLNGLCRDGVLVLVQVGSNGRASRYRCVGAE